MAFEALAASLGEGVLSRAQIVISLKKLVQGGEAGFVLHLLLKGVYVSQDGPGGRFSQPQFPCFAHTTESLKCFHVVLTVDKASSVGTSDVASPSGTRGRDSAWGHVGAMPLELPVPFPARKKAANPSLAIQFPNDVFRHQLDYLGKGSKKVICI